MGINSRSNFIILTVFMVLCANIAAAQEFSADLAATDREGNFKGKIFVGKDKVRMEVPGSVTITRMDQKVVWVFLPAERVFLEQPFDPRMIIASRKELPGETERKSLGNELAVGRLAEKYEVTYEVGGMSQTIIQWIDAKTGIPIKTAASDGSWVMEFRGLKIEAQPDELFELPKNVTKINYDDLQAQQSEEPPLESPGPR